MQNFTILIKLINILFFMKKSTLVSLLASIIAFCLAGFIVFTGHPSNTRHEYKENTSYTIYIEKTQLRSDSVKLLASNAIDKYIKSVAPSSALDGLVIINSCLEYDINPCFVLAQGEIESHFGTKGLARKTNSVFNVFAYDGQDFNEINKSGKYKHPNNSVAPYLDLLKTKYLCENKTEDDLLNDFVNHAGDRYASATDYEKKLSDKYIQIKSTTDIDNLFLELKKFAILLQ